MDQLGDTKKEEERERSLLTSREGGGYGTGGAEANGTSEK
jgi:hypothetical protein